MACSPFVARHRAVDVQVENACRRAGRLCGALELRFSLSWLFVQAAVLSCPRRVARSAEVQILFEDYILDPERRELTRAAEAVANQAKK